MTQPLIVFSCVEDDSGRSVENTLQFVGRLLWRTDQETAAVVDPVGDERVDEGSGRDVVERASDAAQLAKFKKHLALTAVTCLSRDRFDVNRTPKTRTASDPTTWAPSNVKERQQSGMFDTLCLEPVHISSVLSMLSWSRLAAVHCSITEMHCCTLRLRVFRLTVDVELIIVSVHMKRDVAFCDDVG